MVKTVIELTFIGDVTWKKQKLRTKHKYRPDRFEPLTGANNNKVPFSQIYYIKIEVMISHSYVIFK